MAELSTLGLLNDARVYYKLSNTTDEKGVANLTNNNTVTFTTGKYGNAADLGSSNSDKSLTVTSNPLSALQFTAISINFWIKVSGAPANGGAAHRYFELNTAGDNTGMNVFFTYRNPSGTLQLRAGHVLTVTPAIGTYDVDLGTAEFHMITMVISSTTNFKLYLDKVEQIDVTGDGSHSGSGGGTHALAVGKARDASEFASGLVDDLAIFESKALTQGEIDSLYDEAVAARAAGYAFII